jgi:membrane-anchored glycerophosphoryl diester phosphodiesterase (GDPDase)
MAAVPPPQAKAEVGRVLGRGFEALKGDFVPFFAVALLLSGVPGFLFEYLSWSDFQADGSDLILSLPYWAALLGSLFATLLGSALLQGVLVRSTILHLSGRDADIRESLMLGLRLLLPIVGVTFFVSLFFALGLLLLIVPGVMIYCALIVSIPALVEERRGVFGSMRRSRDLTRGSRWRVFLLVMLFVIFSSIISSVMLRLTGVATNGLQPTSPDPLVAGLVTAVTNSLTAVIVAVVLAALYVELREVKEGATTNELADVFS